MSDLNLEQSDRAEVIAAAWYQALADNGEIPEPSESVQPELLDLIRQIIALSSEDQFQTEAARAIGERLARLGYKRVDEIGNAPAILSQQLTQDLDPDQENSTHTRLGNVLTQVITDLMEQQPQTSIVDKGYASTGITRQDGNTYPQIIRSSNKKAWPSYNHYPIPWVSSIGRGIYIYYHAGSERVFIPNEKVQFKNIREYLPAELAEELLIHFSECHRYRSDPGSRILNYFRKNRQTLFPG